MLKQLKLKGEFGKHVATLMTGTFIAQVLPIAISPVLTRIYSPADFGVYALYMAITTVVSVVASGRYELAIMLPDDNHDSGNTMALSAAIALATGIGLWIMAFLYNHEIAEFLDSPSMATWILLLPVSIMLTAFYQTLSYWNNRNTRFKQLSLSRVAHGTTSVSVQCGLGYGLNSSGGLILGNIVGQIFALLYLARVNARSIKDITPFVSVAAIRKNAKHYKKFPLISSWGTLLDNGALQMPLFIIAKVFGAGVTGLFSFSFKVLTVPLFLISGAISQVLFQKVAEIHNNDPAHLRIYILRILLVLICIAVPFTLVFSAFGTVIFSIIFGEDWAQAGEFAETLVIAAGVRFIVSPLSVVLSLNHNIAKGSAWQITYFFTLTTVLILCSGSTIEYFLKALVIHEVVLYGLYLFLILKATKYSPGHGTVQKNEVSLTVLNQNR